MNCPNCQIDNPAGAKFCFNCGSALALSCSSCGTILPAGAKFCFNCGQATAAAPAAPPASPVGADAGRREEMLQRYVPQGLLTKLEAARRSGLVEGERRVVTILFCDLQGSTAAAAGLDPEEWSEIVNGAFKQMIAPVYAYEGTVARLMGDGLLAFFGAPFAHEDDPQRAILAGLEILQAVGRYRLEVEKVWGLSLNVRVGINTGLVVVGAVGSDLRMEYTALGDAINLAARMEQTAAPGTVQIAAATHKLVAPLFDFEAVGDLQVKGVLQPVRAYRVLGVKSAPGSLRGLAGLNAPLIGRQEQMRILQDAVADLGQGFGRIIAVMGEAGLGKSRLVTELRRETAADPDLNVIWLEGKSQSFEVNTPFAPFIAMLRSLFDLEEGQTDSQQLQRIREQLELVMPGRGAAVAPFFGAMFGLQLPAADADRVDYLQPPQLRGLIFAHVQELLQQHLAKRPLLLFLDDLHWVDPTSLELLLALLPLAERLPLLIIAAFRPRRLEPSWQFHEIAQRDCDYRYQAIALSPLDHAQSREMIASLLAVEDLPQQVRQAILDRAEGNPFFVEEIIRSLLDAGVIVQQEGRWHATQEIRSIAIPDTVIGVITTRLDRLDESTRQIAQSAAVLGREFAVDLLGDVVEMPELIAQALVELQRRELIREKSRLPQRTYIFKHVLTQQAAYDSILLSNRRELHRRAAESLLQHQAEQAADIARHWLGARQQARAIPYLVQAGNQAARAYATTEAIEFYMQVIRSPAAAADLMAAKQAYEGLGQILVFAARIPEALDTFQELLTLGEAQGDVSMQISAYNKLASTNALHLGQFQQADQYLAQADALVLQSKEQSGAAETALIRCQMCTAQADFNGVLTHMGRLIETGQQLNSKAYMALGLEHVASSLVWLTRYDEAEEMALEALEVARDIGDREHEAVLLAMTLPLCAIRNGDLKGAADLLLEGLAISEKIGAIYPLVCGNWIAGEIAQWQGAYEQALAYEQSALENALPLEAFMPWMVVQPLGSLGYVYLLISDKFQQEIAKFHYHALKLLESPAGTMTGSTAWADLGYCAMALGDFEIAGDSFQKGLNQPNIFMEVERPRLMSGAALLAQINGDLEQARSLAEGAYAYAAERKMRHMLPLTNLNLGKILAAQGQEEGALAALSAAEETALELNMRPLVWQARLAAAAVMAKNGRLEEAAAKRAAAKTVVEEIAGLFQDQTLQQAYLRHTAHKFALSASE